MDQVERGFVALIDVLGFVTFAPAKQRLVVDLIAHFVDDAVPKLLEAEWHNNGRWFARPVVRAYSDTIVLLFPLNSERRIAQDVFYSINAFIGRLQSLFLLDGVLLRGALGYGDLCIWKYGVYGSAVVDVKSEFENTNWSGVHYGAQACRVAAQWLRYKIQDGIIETRTIHHTSHSAYDTNFVLWNVPFKTAVSHTQRLVVPWPKEIAITMTFEEIVLNSAPTPFMRVLHAVEPLMQSSESSLAAKGRNTLDFVRWYLSRFSDFNVIPEVSGPIAQLDNPSEQSTEQDSL